MQVEIIGGEGIDVKGVGPGNTIAIVGEYATSGPTVLLANKGIAAFDSTYFSVVNGFVKLVASTSSIFTAEDGTTAVPLLGNLKIVGTATNGISTTAFGNTMVVGMSSPYSDGDFSFENNAIATPRYVRVKNNNIDLGSYSALGVSVRPAGGDAFIFFEVDGATQYYSAGIDNSVAGDPWKLTNNVDPSSGNALIAFTNTGVITLFNDLDVTEGGTGVSTLTSHGILMGNGVGDVQATAEPTDGQLLIGKTGNFPQLGNITSLGNRLTVTNGAGTIDLDTKAVLQTDTGFGTWSAGGPYFDDTTLGSFTVLVAGTGYIKGVPITWTGPQTVAGMTAGNCYFIYIDNTGTIGKTATRTDALYQDYIVLFECLRDSTPVTNNQVSVKENHPYNYPVNVSNYEHDVIGSVIENNLGGANIVLNGTKKIQINGLDYLADHGLDTTIPDSAGAAVTWQKKYTTAAGKWALQNQNDTFAGYYNAAGTPTVLGGSKFGVYTLYVSKDNLNSTTPKYFAVLDTSQYNNLTAAQTAINNGTVAKSSNELQSLELAQLGYIIFSQAADAIVQVIIAKATLKSTISISGTNIASLVITDTTNFNAWLSAADTNVQAALNTLDDVGLNVSPQYAVLTAGAAYAIHPLAVGATGTLLVGATAGYPAFGTSAVGDFTFTSATAAQDRTLTVSNTDNTAVASSAHLQLTVGGSTSTGDPYINFLVTGAGTFNIGIDNSASDSFKIASAAFGTFATDLMIFTNSIVTTPTDFAVGRADKGNSRGYLNVTHANAAKWASGNWMIPNIEAFDEGAGTASTIISLCSQTDNNGICRFAWINVPGNNQAGTLYLAHGDAAGADAALVTKLSISDQGVVTLTNDLDVTEGGTGVSTLTSHGILMGNGAGDIQATAEPANGKLLIGKAGDFPQVASLTSTDSSITVTEGAGTLNVSGKVVQQLYVESQASSNFNTVIPGDNTIPQSGEGTEIFTKAITPTSATNILKITAVVHLCPAGVNVMSITLFQDAGANALAAASILGGQSNAIMILKLVYYKVAGATAATTFKIRAGGNTAGNVYLNDLATVANWFGNVLVSSLTIEEIKP